MSKEFDSQVNKITPYTYIIEKDFKHREDLFWNRSQ